jgi:hypothetical protein
MKGKKGWRLSRTLKRRIEVRPIENYDVKYAWAAYKQGKLNDLPLPGGMDAASFKAEFEKFVLTNTHAAWTILSQTKQGFIPTGMVLGQWGPSFMFISAIEWFPWASCRNIIEGTVYFFNSLRKQFPVFGFANEEHKPLYETCCAHGIMYRVGSSHSLGEKMTVFEVRTNNK